VKLTPAQMKVLQQARADGNEIVLSGIDATDPTPRRDVVNRLVEMGLLVSKVGGSLALLSRDDTFRLTEDGWAVLEGRSPELSRALDTLMTAPEFARAPRRVGGRIVHDNGARREPEDAAFRHGRGPAPKDPYKRIIWAAQRGQGTTLKPEDVQMLAGDTAIHDAATGDGLDAEDDE
jgi:hypothetical protein